MADIVEEIRTLSGYTHRQVVRCARRGTIKACRLVQWDDDQALYDGFRYSLWESREAAPPMLVAHDDSRNPDHWDRVQHQIGETREVPRGRDELTGEDGKPDTKVDWTYRNRDNGGSQTNMLRQIYLELVDLGPPDRDRVKTYKLFLTVEPKTE